MLALTLLLVTACADDVATQDLEQGQTQIETQDTDESEADEVNKTENEHDAADLHAPDVLIENWGAALQYLKEGNERFVSHKPIDRLSVESDLSVLGEGQMPFAIVVTCSDSRVAPEIYFDQRLGDIFVIRNAGNIADTVALGSIEFAAGHLQAPLIVVVGHSACGAIKGAMGGGEFSPNLQHIIDHIASTLTEKDDATIAARENVKTVVAAISQNDVVAEVGTKVIGAYFDIETGTVTFYDE